MTKVAAHEREALLPLRPMRIRLEGLQAGLRVEHEIERADIMTERQEMWDQPAANVAESASDEYFCHRNQGLWM